LLADTLGVAWTVTARGPACVWVDVKPAHGWLTCHSKSNGVNTNSVLYRYYTWAQR